MNSPQRTSPILEKQPLTDYEQSLTQARDAALCAASINYFATKHVWIQNQNTQKIEKWQPWPYLLDLNDIIQSHDLIYILKASQLGISWDVAMINLHIALFNETCKCLLLSQGQTESFDLLSKVGFIHSCLPDYLRLPTDKDNREAFVLRDGRSEVRALPSTDKAGHGFQGSLVTRDELARHDFARDNFKAVARSGARMIELSTANKHPSPSTQNGYFGEETEAFWCDTETVKYVYPSGVELYTNENRPGQCLVFLGWRLRPTRRENLSLDEWWAREVESRYTPQDIEEQFPSRIEEVFRASLTRAYFEITALDDMGYDVCPPARKDEDGNSHGLNTFNDVVRVYKPPLTGRKYILFTDPSDGVGDPFVTGVMDYVTGEIVASATGMEKVDRVAEIHDYLSREYKATNSFEYNGSTGGSMWTCLQNLETPLQAPRRKTDGKIDPGKKGQTVSGQHKEKIIGDLAFAITKRQIVCHDKEFMQQAKMVQRDGNKPLMARNTTFDWVMMMAGLNQLMKYAPTSEMRVTSMRYGESPNQWSDYARRR